MKTYGKVIEYDGYTGTIKGVDGNDYLLLDTEVMTKDLAKDDYVSFDGEVYRDIEFTKYVARFIKKIEKDEYKD